MGPFSKHQTTERANFKLWLTRSLTNTDPEARGEIGFFYVMRCRQIQELSASSSQDTAWNLVRYGSKAAKTEESLRTHISARTAQSGAPHRSK
jgi:hypothetical protein